MDGINQTLYIPLYGKAYVSSRGLFLHDPTAERLWKNAGFSLRGKAKSKWLAYYMSMRAVTFDHWLQEKMELHRDAVIIHIGCGLDSRVERVGTQGHLWFDVDFPDVIEERKKFFVSTDSYKMIPSDVREESWLSSVPKGCHAIVVMEGVSMYLRPSERFALVRRLCAQFHSIDWMMDCYTELAAKATKYKNPINEMGVTVVYGMDDPKSLEVDGLHFVQEHSMTPEELISALSVSERCIFRTLFAGKISRKLYRMYEYQK